MGMTSFERWTSYTGVTMHYQTLNISLYVYPKFLQK